MRPSDDRIMPMKVMLVDNKPDRSAMLKKALFDAGCNVVARIGPNEDLLSMVLKHQPDVVIVDIESPDRDVLEHMRSISRDQPKPIVMFSENGDSNMIREAVQAGVSAYVVDGLDSRRVRSIMDVAIARFREFQSLREELQQAKSHLADRKTIEKAKGILMKHKGVNEEQAYKLIRKMAMDENRKIIEIARNIISVARLLDE